MCQILRRGAEARGATDPAAKRLCNGALAVANSILRTANAALRVANVILRGATAALRTAKIILRIATAALRARKIGFGRAASPPARRSAMGDRRRS
ncbi:MAG TPA: hypothetical protein VMM92_04245 [Thermoanaerobaculia bacterium]|nr:hypothetical protein [Thermoanaerobaculia bacterium]